MKLKISLKASMVICIFLFMAITLPVSAKEAKEWSSPSTDLYQKDDDSVIVYRFYNPNPGTNSVIMTGVGELKITGKNNEAEFVLLNFTVSSGGEFSKEYRLPDWATRATVNVIYEVDGKSYPAYKETAIYPKPKPTPRTPGFGVIGGIIALAIIGRKKW